MNDAAPAQALRVALLASDDAHHRYLAACLDARFALAALVVEPADAQLRRLRQRGKWRDWGYALYHRYRRRVFGLTAYRRQYFALPDGSPEWPRTPDIVADWINEPAVESLLRRTAPDVTIVICTSILSRRTLAAAGTTINIHGGFLPWYRGNHCFFFALLDRRFEHIGSTIHFVDAGVDTGDIIAQAVPRLLPDDTAETLYCRAEGEAISLLVDLLGALAAGHPLPRRPQPPGGRQYYTRDRKPHHDLRMWARRLRGRMGFPADSRPERNGTPSKIYAKLRSTDA